MKRATPLTPAIVGIIVTALSLTSCNIFDPIDGPGSDNAQLLSAARACFDSGDYACAREYYGKISSPTDQIKAEQAFLRLDPLGASIGSFMVALGSGGGSPGSIVTKVANSIGKVSPGEATRLEIYRAFNDADTLSATPQQQGLVRFIAAMSMVGAILSEGSFTRGNLKKSDLVVNATTCADANVGSCGSTAACDIRSDSAIKTGANPGGMNSTAETDFDSTPTIGMLRAALSEINPALTKMSATGQSSGDFATQILATGNDRCLLWSLITNQVGN